MYFHFTEPLVYMSISFYKLMTSVLCMRHRNHIKMNFFLLCIVQTFMQFSQFICFSFSVQFFVCLSFLPSFLLTYTLYLPHLPYSLSFYLSHFLSFFPLVFSRLFSLRWKRSNQSFSFGGCREGEKTFREDFA